MLKEGLIQCFKTGDSFQLTNFDQNKREELAASAVNCSNDLESGMTLDKQT